MSQFKTPTKGTTLHLRKLHGKDYMDVMWRLVWFREEKPNWSIQTESVSVTATGAYFKAIIRDDKGNIVATAHKTCTSKEFVKFVEKAETGAIGRALAHCGFGTQFTGDELTEDENTLADSPVERSARGSSLGTPLKSSVPPRAQSNKKQQENFF